MKLSIRFQCLWYLGQEALGTSTEDNLVTSPDWQGALQRELFYMH